MALSKIPCQAMAWMVAACLVQLVAALSYEPHEALRGLLIGLRASVTILCVVTIWRLIACGWKMRSALKSVFRVDGMKVMLSRFLTIVPIAHPVANGVIVLFFAATGLLLSPEHLMRLMGYQLPWPWATLALIGANIMLLLTLGMVLGSFEYAARNYRNFMAAVSVSVSPAPVIIFFCLGGIVWNG